MKQAFITKNFSPDRKATIAKANEIIEQYQQAGYRLTLRQLYYQFVSKDLIVNSERSYKNLGSTINEGRLAGLIDWEAIEDRVRVPKQSSEWSDIESLVNSADYSYRLPRWNGQPNYVELWVEKDALAGVLQPIAEEYHITLMVNRGYSSQSAMYESAQRFHRAARKHENLHLLYLGDHDPSGEDMVRDIRERMEMFGVELEVVKLALNMSQVEQYDPPPNPAKMTDSRAKGYVDKHGEYSWEVDALRPEVLAELIRDAIKERLDQGMMDVIISRENKDKAALAQAARRINK